MMSRPGHEHSRAAGSRITHATPGSHLTYASLLEDNAEDLYENAPCGYLFTLMDGQIVKANRTLLGWLNRSHEEVVGHMRFADLLTVGGKLYHETHFAPLLRLQGEVSGIALDLKAADGTRLPVLVTSTVMTDNDENPVMVRTTVSDARDRRSYETELLRAREEAEHERERFKRLASTLQRTLVPPALTPPPNLDVAAHYHIASRDEVSGDFYDLFPLVAGGGWGLFLGDVCGKGAPAAALTSLARYSLRAAAVYDPDPVTVLNNLNTVLNTARYDEDPRFCTVVFGKLTPEREGFTVTLASGGHPNALLLRAHGTAEYLPTPGGQLIGVLPDPDVATTTVHLTAGDTLLLYTDGLTEAHTSANADDRYGDEALLNFANVLAPGTAAETVAAIAELLDAFGDGLDDDTAVMALGVPSR